MNKYKRIINISAKTLVFIFIVRLFSFLTIFDFLGSAVVIKTVMRLFTDILLMFMLVSYWKKHMRIKFLGIGLIYILYIDMSILSLIYTSSFDASFIQLLMYFESLIFAYLFVRLLIVYNNSYYIPHILYYSISWIAIVFYIGFLLLPEVFLRYTATDDTYRLGGFIINPNELGVLLVIGIVSSFLIFKYSSLYYKIIMLVVNIIMLYSLYLTYSRSSIVALFVTIFIIYYLNTKNKNIIIIIYIGMLSLIPFIINKVFVRGDQAEDLVTMTGRLPFWKDLLNDAFPQEWLLGYGFQRIYYTQTYASQHSYTAEMAHNTYLQILLNLGLIGALIGLIFLLLLNYIIVKLKNDIKKNILISILIPILINSITEFGIFGFYNFDVLFLHIILFYLMLTYKERKLIYVR